MGISGASKNIVIIIIANYYNFIYFSRTLKRFNILTEINLTFLNVKVKFKTNIKVFKI